MRCISTQRCTAFSVSGSSNIRIPSVGCPGVSSNPPLTLERTSAFEFHASDTPDIRPGARCSVNRGQLRARRLLECSPADTTRVYRVWNYEQTLALFCGLHEGFCGLHEGQHLISRHGCTAE